MQNNYGPYKLCQVFNLGVKGHMNVMIVHSTLSNDYAPTYKISLIYLERQNNYGPYKLRQVFDLGFKASI